MDVKSILSGTIGADAFEVPFGGHLLLERPLLNKGTAFTREERRAFGLLGLLPPTEETLDEQAARAFEAYSAKRTDLGRHVYLRQLQDTNETLFYRLLLDHLATTLPIVLDVGTNNRERLEDPLYVGWRHERIAGDEYDAFIDAVVAAVVRKFPGVLLQWEDFAQAHAGPILDRYRDRLCTFNDDIQGTAAVTTGTLLAAVAIAGGRLRDQRVAILGAGSAGCGIGEQLVAAMVEEGLAEHEARSRFFLIDRQGLLHDGLAGLRRFQERFVQPKDRVTGWRTGSGETIGLLDVVQNARPTILIGVSGQPGTFTEAIVRAMAEHVDRPIIFPLSNPTSRAEASPADLIAWTDGRAWIATGSPFDDVLYGDRRYPVAQCNNSYIFPGLGLGVLAVKAQRVSDAMFMAAARALAGCSPARDDPAGPLLPPLAESRRVSRVIALAVAAAAQRDGLAAPCRPEKLVRLVDSKIWQPHYLPMRPKLG